MIQERDARQRDIVPPEQLATVRATVVGVGAIGRQVALQLAAMGVPWLQLIDPDVVEPANLACQGFLESDLGCEKVDAVMGPSSIDPSLLWASGGGSFRPVPRSLSCSFSFAVFGHPLHWPRFASPGCPQ